MGFSVAFITTVSDVSQILMNLSSDPVRKANNTFLTLQLEKGEQGPWELPATTERSQEQRRVHSCMSPDSQSQPSLHQTTTSCWQRCRGLADAAYPSHGCLCSAPTQGRHPWLRPVQGTVLPNSRLRQRFPHLLVPHLKASA